MLFLLGFRRYQRQFKRPLVTHHGLWQNRTGILVRIVDPKQRVGYGEIAPVSWFGSETDQQAWNFCQTLAGHLLTTDFLKKIPPELPACQFGLEMALEDCLDSETGSLEQPAAVPHSGLLPTGMGALSAWRSLYAQGYRTFKWKIGVAPLADELQHFKGLVTELPPDSRLRLDANGGLTMAEAEIWLALCDAWTPIVEFLEQPLAPAQFDQMQSLGGRYQTPLALDESVATLAQLENCWQRGWRGVFVIKPAIAGSPSRLRQVCQRYSLNVVCSSVFETAIGRRAGLKLAAELSHPGRAAGYGVSHWFADGLDQDTCSAETVWQNC